MAWLESHQEIDNHPKLSLLISLTKSSKNECIGILHRLWWWTLSYAENGYLGKYNPLAITTFLSIEEVFYSHLITSGWIDDDNYIHDWWDYVGRFLQVKYKHKPEKWQEIKALYDNRKNRSNNRSKNRQGVSSKNYKPNITNITDITEQNITIPYLEIITDLNSKVSKNYKPTKNTKDLINARIKEGFTFEDFQKVHSNMSAKWKHDPKMEQYLRPSTLYNASKFEGYLNTRVSLSDQGKISPLLDKSQRVFQDFIKEQGDKNAERNQI
uniref:Putative replication protein n=1 Tax=viral metagenome TaxID=1070528 RepID=A0A6M3J741_9ZZZZ